jgi:hypothetical protein
MEDFETEIKDLDYMEHCSYKLQVGWWGWDGVRRMNEKCWGRGELVQSSQRLEATGRKTSDDGR